MMDMNNLFAAIKAHITDATQQLSGDFKQVVDENTRFKQGIREELDEMRQFLADQKRVVSIQSSPGSSSSLTAPSITPTVQVSSTPPVASNSSAAMAPLPS